MPILKFHCNDCEKEFAKIFFSPEQAPKTCTVCGSENIREQGAAFHADAQTAARSLGASCDPTGESCGDGCGTCGVAVPS